jgi:hypothetical protein
VLKLGLVSESVRVDVVIEGVVTGAGILKIPAQHVYIELILVSWFTGVLYFVP